MKVTTERLEDCQVKVIVEMDAAAIDKELRRTAAKLSRQYTVPGYRRGKAPYHAVLRVFGREVVQQQALEDFGNELYDKALEEIDYEPYQAGELEDVEWDPFRMTILLPIKPELDLGDYRTVRVPFEPESIGEERIDEYLRQIQQNNAQWIPVERPAAPGDLVVIDAEGKIGTEVVLSLQNEEMNLETDSHLPLPGFHAEIVGMQAGEEKAFTLTYPEDDPEEMVRGKEAAFVVKLHSVKEQDLPALDDDLAMMVGDYDSLEALTAAIREEMETEALRKAEDEYLDRILEAMIEGAVKIEYPTQAIDHEADLILNQMERNLASSGLQLDKYLAMVGTTRELYKKDLRASAEGRLKKRLVLAEIGRREGLEVAPEEIEAEIERLSEMVGEDAEQMRAMLDTPEGRLSVADDLILAQVQERLKQIAQGEAPPLEVTEAEAETESPVETELEPEAAPVEEEQARAGGEPESGGEEQPQEEVEAKADSEEAMPDASAQGEEPASDANAPNRTVG